MCFSAEVSYGSAALLMVTGAVTTLGNRSSERAMIAAVPFLFGIQQISEGIVWQSMAEGSTSFTRYLGAVSFLTFAYIVWPAWMPWSFYFIEPDEKRRRILKGIGIAGIFIAAMAGWVLYSVDVNAYVTGHSVGYAFPNLHRFWPANIEAFLYLTPTVIPFFVSSLKTIKKAGYLIFVSMVIARIINDEAASSIWCLFAALISFYISVHILWWQKGRIT